LVDWNQKEDWTQLAPLFLEHLRNSLSRLGDNPSGAHRKKGRTGEETRSLQLQAFWLVLKSVSVRMVAGLPVLCGTYSEARNAGLLIKAMAEFA
jgi:hypothetical protein